MKPARELAHDSLNDRCGDRYERFGHTGECDRLTQIISARDAEWKARLATAREALKRYGQDFEGPAICPTCCVRGGHTSNCEERTPCPNHSEIPNSSRPNHEAESASYLEHLGPFARAAWGQPEPTESEAIKPEAPTNAPGPWKPDTRNRPDESGEARVALTALDKLLEDKR